MPPVKQGPTGEELKTTGMNTPRTGGRLVKNTIRKILTSMEMEQALEALYQIPARQAINPLFSFLYAGDDLLRWKAITAMGRIAARLADDDREAARVIMRRLMWNLNDESGGIGWGSPEAMGEILACHDGLAEEYAPILISYAREDGNYLEYEMLQRGLLWGIARLAEARPHRIRNSVSHLMPCLEAGDPATRGLSAHIMGLLMVREARRGLESLREDDAEFQTWTGCRIVHRRVNDMVKEALERLSASEGNGLNRKGGLS
jgi:hypothetical protein